MSSNSQYKISLIALSRSVDMILSSSVPELLDELISEFIMLFEKNVDYENQKISIDSLQQNTEALRERFKQFVDQYKEKEPKLNQLNGYFKALKNNENFYWVINSTINTEEFLKLCNNLTALEEGKSPEVIQEEIDDLSKDLLLNYDLKIFDKTTQKRIGEKDKAKRICRFCGKKSPEVSFKNEAHAISEALGNKKIILNEECDTCNGRFGSKVEIHLIEYLRFYSVFYGIKGKGKIPEIKAPETPIKENGKNFAIKNDGGQGLTLKYYNDDETSESKDVFPLKLELRTDKEIIDQNIYKTFVKYALSVIDSQHLPFFSETIKWLNGEKSVNKLPKIGMLVTNSFFDKHPRMTLHIRKNNNYDLPYTLAEFRFTSFTFSFVIPFCSEDKKDFLNNTDYELFWKTFKHYNKVKGWKYIDCSDDKSKRLIHILNLNKSE